jgi:transcriptional regulator with XRE-family HTH domain
MTHVGENVRFHRRRLGLNQRELARLSELTQPSISELESGRRAPHPRTIRKLAGALGVSHDALFERVDPPGHEERWEMADAALRGWMDQCLQRLGSGGVGKPDLLLMAAAAQAFGPGRDDRLSPEERKRFRALLDLLAEEGAARLGWEPDQMWTSEDAEEDEEEPRSEAGAAHRNTA